MRLLLAVLIGIVLITTDAVAGMIQGKDTIREHVALRRDLLALRYQFTWPDTMPAIRIGFRNKNLNQMEVLRAMTYQDRPRTIWVSPLVVPLADSVTGPRKILHNTVREYYGDIDPKFDHELVHDLYTLTLRRLTGSEQAMVDTNKVGEVLAYKIMTEGAAQAIEKHVTAQDTSDVGWPEFMNIYNQELLSMPERFEALVYDQGSILMGPLIREFGLLAVTEYSIQKPLQLRSSRIREQITAWRRQAWADLAVLKQQATQLNKTNRTPP